VEAADQLSAGMGHLGITVLHNSVADFRGLQIAGCDDWWAGRHDAPGTIAQLDDRHSAIFLCHNPDVVDLPGWRGYEGWILAGHTHGGQCCVPGYGAPIVPIQNKLYAAGEFALDGNRRLYVNRGLGYKRRVRFMSRPEITVFHLHTANT
jgi:predicted MPP superfamily phosphohydrolase